MKYLADPGIIPRGPWIQWDPPRLGEEGVPGSDGRLYIGRRDKRGQCFDVVRSQSGSVSFAVYFDNCTW